MPYELRYGAPMHGLRLYACAAFPDAWQLFAGAQGEPDGASLYGDAAYLRRALYPSSPVSRKSGVCNEGVALCLDFGRGAPLYGAEKSIPNLKKTPLSGTCPSKVFFVWAKIYSSSSVASGAAAISGVTCSHKSSQQSQSHSKKSSSS